MGEREQHVVAKGQVFLFCLFSAVILFFVKN